MGRCSLLNQEDFQEQMHQVRTMGLVYSGAKEVIAWLGEEKDGTKMAMELLESWVTFISMPDEFEELRAKQSRSARMEQRQKLATTAIDPRANLALLEFAENPYWTRAWICQELSLGESVVFQCGRVSKSLDFLLKIREGVVTFLTTFFTNHGGAMVEPFWKLIASKMSHMLSMVRRLRGMRWETLPLLLLIELRIMRSTDPRDKVFALLGFVALDGPFFELIAPDYEKSTEQVYLDVARYLILTEQTLDVLNRRESCLSIGRSPSIPTWAPDWQLPEERRRSHFDNSGNKRVLNKSKFVSQLVTFLPGGKLSAKGFELDVVLEVLGGFFLPFDSTLEDSNPTFKTFIKCIVSRPLVRRETTLSAFIRLISPNHRVQSDHSFFERAADFLRYIYMTNIRREYFMADVSPSTLATACLGEDAAQSEKERLESLILDRDLNSGLDYDYYHFVYCTLLANYSIFRTESGSLGMGFEGLAKGDVLCHLAAHPKPFLLRPAGLNYTNVEDCVVLDLELAEVKEEMIPDMRDFVIE